MDEGPCDQKDDQRDDRADEHGDDRTIGRADDDPGGHADDPASSRRNVVLTGFMGTGKSTVGRLLAARLGYEFVDTDELIESRHGPIPRIFGERGEDEFRRLERDVAAELAGSEGMVIATGGKMMVDAVNAERLGASSDVICLTAPVDTIVERVSAGRTDRPMLAGDDVEARIESLLLERAAAYERYLQVDTDGRTPDQVADVISELLARR